MPKLITGKYIRVDGYYYSIDTINQDEYDNHYKDFFDGKEVRILKFSNDGYCNFFISSVLKGKTVEQNIDKILKIDYTEKTPINSGVYEENERNILIQYYIFNNPNHFIGRYALIQYYGTIEENGDITLLINERKFNFKFVEKKGIAFPNYIKENPKKFWK